MGRYKCAYNCDSSSDSDVKYFKFPLFHSRRLKKWLTNMNMKDWSPSRFSALCINHFEEKFIDRSGKTVTLREDAVPTVFLSPANTTQTKRDCAQLKSERNEEHCKITPAPAEPPTASPDPLKEKVPEEENSVEGTTGATEQEPSLDVTSAAPGRWGIVADEWLTTIESFPHFFHGYYCAPQDILWAPDDNAGVENKDPDHIIEVKEPWEWLGLDVRGPLPKTLNGHSYILTLVDYYSKWVEAAPVESCLPAEVAKRIVDAIAHFGFPVRILSRLPNDIVDQINQCLKTELSVDVPLVVFHQQTGPTDLVTHHSINRLVSDLIEDHAADWDVHLPADVFRMCCAEHPKTNERPFTLLCCSGVKPVSAPRRLDYEYSRIQESSFLVR